MREGRLEEVMKELRLFVFCFQSITLDSVEAVSNSTDVHFKAKCLELLSLVFNCADRSVSQVLCCGPSIPHGHLCVFKDSITPCTSDKTYLSSHIIHICRRGFDSAGVDAVTS